jgi:hypothetical protein
MNNQALEIWSIHMYDMTDLLLIERERRFTYNNAYMPLPLKHSFCELTLSRPIDAIGGLELLTQPLPSYSRVVQVLSAPGLRLRLLDVLNLTAFLYHAFLLAFRSLTCSSVHVIFLAALCNFASSTCLRESRP